MAVLFGNVITAPLPCGKFTIRSTTTRYFKKSKYEFTGIPPVYTIKREQDWNNMPTVDLAKMNKAGAYIACMP